MKKTILTLGIVFLLPTIFVSCQKDKTVSKSPMAQNGQKMQTMSADNTVFLLWEWYGWGRAKYDCLSGGGLCGFHRVKTKVEQVAAGSRFSPIFSDSLGNRFVEIWADADLVFEDSTKSLYIDEDIIDSEDGITIKANAGIYSFDNKIGTLGGYIIPVTVY